MNIKKSAVISVIAISLLTACGENAPAEIRETESESQTVSITSAAAETSEEFSESEIPTEAEVTEQVESETAKEEAVTEERSNTEDFLAEYDWAAQNAAIEIYEKLIESFTESDGDITYLENYSGAYYVSEESCLYIALTDISESAVKPYRDITGDENVKFVQHKYSYNSLLVLNEYVVGLMSEGGFEIYGVGIYEKDNRVGITAGSQEALEVLKSELISKGFEEDMFEISIGEPVILY
ncbi:MAG: hypothetical protein K2K57_10290 [Oscillospiraceae bacterium]|nr:hypothetical protein [Oscillospiraceae bacterium]